MSAKKKTVKARKRLVRVVPYDARMGYLARNITWRGRKFTEQWTEVSAIVASQLQALDQPGRDGVRLFDVRTEAQVQRMEEVDSDKQMRKLISANKLKESELREQQTRRQPRDDFDDPEDEDEDEGAEEEEEFEPDPDPDGSKAAEESRAEEAGEKDWSKWEADMNSAGEDDVEGPPVPAKRKGATAKKRVAKKAAKKTSKGKTQGRKNA